MFTRRKFLKSATAGGALAAVPGLAVANTDLGGMTLSTVSDGHLTLPGGFGLDGMPIAQRDALIAKYGLSPDQMTPECNLTLVRDGDKNILFDVGSGPDFMPSAGLLTESLDALDLTPDDITHVVFTHAHPDHIWGLLDDFDDPMFYNATYMMGRKEWDYWWNPNTVNEIDAARTTFAVGAKRRMEAIEDAVEFFDDGDEILPGIAAVASFGHTPGHMSFDINTGKGTNAMIVGDAIGNHHLAFEHPDWPSGSDQDPQAGITSRKMLFDRVMTQGSLLVGFHLPQGGLGHVDRMGDGLRFVPMGDA